VNVTALVKAPLVQSTLFLIAIMAIHFHNLNIRLIRPFWPITLTSFDAVKQYTMSTLRQQYNLTSILEAPDFILWQMVLLRTPFFI
jgi:hypothetical protein